MRDRKWPGRRAIARQQRGRRSSAGQARVKRSPDCRRRQGSPGASARPGLGTASRSSDGRTLAHAWQIPLKCPNPLRLADRMAPEDLLDYANPDHNSASRVRFCPPPQRTFGVPPRGFFLRPTGMDSTYSRPVLAARGNLGAARSSVKGGGWALTEIAGFPVDPPLVPRCSARKPFRHFDRISVRGNRTRSSARGRRGSGAATQLSAAPAVRSSSTASVSL